MILSSFVVVIVGGGVIGTMSIQNCTQALPSFFWSVSQPYPHCIYVGDLVFENSRTNFGRGFFQQCRLDALVHGNVSAQQAYDITTMVWQKTHPTTTTTSESANTIITRAPLEKRVVQLVNTTTNNNGSTSSSSSSLTSSLVRMRNIMELSGISGTNFTDWRLQNNRHNISNDNNNDIGAISYQNNNDTDTDTDTDNDHQLQKAFQREEESSPLNNLGQVKVPPIKCLHAHYAHYRSTCTVVITDDNESDYSETSRTKTAVAAAVVVTHTANPVGEMIHKQLKKDFSGLDL
mmetsp:Transcript_40019/g.44804  ORF Transcript_40019/g.44804 Transcript_40019/m.44804 type:complete len:291 (+) Transcript_40019:1501-2373(+)